jgi:hypothetical protein
MATVVANSGPNGNLPGLGPCKRPTSTVVPGNLTPGPAYTRPGPASWRGLFSTPNALGTRGSSYVPAGFVLYLRILPWREGGRAEASCSEGCERRRACQARSEGQEFQQGKGGAAVPLGSFCVPRHNCGKPATCRCFLGANYRTLRRSQTGCSSATTEPRN